MVVNTFEPAKPQVAVKKQSYTVPCSSRFRDEVTKLALAKHCNVADLARSVALVVPLDIINAYPDPGEPERGDRETVVLKSGASKGKPWRRKPRLQVRMGPGFALETIRKSLSLAIAIEHGYMDVGVESESDKSQAEQHRDTETKLMRDALEELERLRNTVAVLQGETLANGVVTRVQALYVLGFAPGSIPDQSALRSRFRRMATVYHPDGKDGSHEHMSQLNAAMEILRRGGL